MIFMYCESYYRIALSHVPVIDYIVLGTRDFFPRSIEDVRGRTNKHSRKIITIDHVKGTCCSSSPETHQEYCSQEY